MTSKKLRRVKKYLNTVTRTRTRRLKYLNSCNSYIYANLDLAFDLGLRWLMRRLKHDYTVMQFIK